MEYTAGYVLESASKHVDSFCFTKGLDGIVQAAARGGDEDPAVELAYGATPREHMS
jgi:hypothetical protein